MLAARWMLALVAALAAQVAQAGADGAWPDIGTRGLNANGSHGGMLRLMVDGHDMAWRQFGWNLVDRSWVDLEDVDRIEIVRGPTAAVWGNGAIGGAVNVVTRDWTK